MVKNAKQTNINSNSIIETTTSLNASNSINPYSNQLCDAKLLTSKEECLFEKAQKGDAEARNKIVCENVGLVVSIAKKYANMTTLELNDLIQEGNIGLMNAINKFEYQRGFKFSTYAVNWIKQAITRAINNNGRTIRLPEHEIEKLSKILTFKDEYYEKNGFEPPMKTVSKSLDIDEDTVKVLLQYSKPILSLDMTVGDEDDTTLGEVVYNTNEFSIIDNVNQNDELMQLATNLKKLTHKERTVIINHYGLFNTKQMTYKQLGRLMHIGSEKIKQIEEEGMVKLKTLYLNDGRIYNTSSY